MQILHAPLFNEELAKAGIPQEIANTPHAEISIVYPDGEQTPIVIKSIKKPEKKEGQSADLELRALEALKHPNIIRLLGHTYINNHITQLGLEYVPGRSLEENISNTFLLPHDAAPLLVQAAGALEYMHGGEGHPSYVHNDISSYNFLVRTDGVVKLADFGFAYPLEGIP